MMEASPTQVFLGPETPRRLLGTARHPGTRQCEGKEPRTQ
jgi:hypothetical protein